MAFPTTSVLDAFNRSESGPLAGNWTNKIASGDFGSGCSANGTECIGANTAVPRQYWNVASYTETEVYCTIAGDGDWFALFGRIQDAGGTPTAYEVEVRINAQTCNWYKWSSGTRGSAVKTVNRGSNWSAGDGFGLEIKTVGADVTVALYKRVSGTWSLVDTYTDSSSPITSAGRIGIWPAYLGRIDDFGGGEIVAATTGGGASYYSRLQ